MTRLSKDDFIVVDPGKHEVKGMVFSKTGTVKGVFSFPSKSKKVRGFNNNETSSSKQFRLQLNGKKFLVGEGVPAEYNADITKTNDHHKLCVYSSVASVVGNHEELVNLVIGSPTNDFELSENVDRYKTLIRGNSDGHIDMTINGDDKSFVINSLDVFPEGMAVLPRAMKKSPSKVHVVDIGGQNVNYRLYDEKGNTINYFSLDYAGMNKLEQKLKTELRFAMTSHAFDIDSIDWNRAISDGKVTEIENLIDEDDENVLSGYDDTEEFVRENVESFIEDEILTPLVQKGVYLQQKGHAILFTGGGSLRLENYLKEVLSNNVSNMEVSKTAKWDNCISYAMRYLSQVEKDKAVVTKAVVKIIKETKEPDFEENHNFLEAEEAIIG